jgi:hypothetical protein
MFGRGAGGEGKDLSLHWDAPHHFTKKPHLSMRLSEFLIERLNQQY